MPGGDSKASSCRQQPCHQGRPNIGNGEDSSSHLPGELLATFPKEETTMAPSHSVKQDKQSMKGGSSSFVASTIMSRTLFAGVSVIGIFSALCAYTLYGAVSLNGDDGLTESAEDFSYYDHMQSNVKLQGYGSPDLISEHGKRELKARLSKGDREQGQVEKKGRAEVGENTGRVNGAAGFQGTGGRVDRYVVVFDAGSTGTRLHIFQFRYNDDGMELVDELFQRIKPGLADFVYNPDQGAASLQGMIDTAVKMVPSSLHKSTPLVFKATAGFRLLKASSADFILGKVRERLLATDFDFSPADVNIMGGIEEGLFGWITVNFLLGKLPSLSSMAATLDLGGASMQISHKPLKPEEHPEDLQHLEFLGTVHSVYTHSYLGAGLMATRYSILKDGGDGSLVSDCLPMAYSGIFHYGGKDHIVRGPDVPSSDGCWLQVGQFLSSQHFLPLWDLIESKQTEVYLFSYFYDVLQWAAVIDNEQAEIVLTVSDIYQAAEKVCKFPDLKMPFLCLDLTYITRLLGEAFMFWNKSLHVVSEINSRETSWALGAALDALSKVEA